MGFVRRVPQLRPVAEDGASPGEAAVKARVRETSHRKTGLCSAIRGSLHAPATIVEGAGGYGCRVRPLRMFLPAERSFRRRLRQYSTRTPAVNTLPGNG